jgi:hypothetical protein
LGVDSLGRIPVWRSRDFVQIGMKNYMIFSHLNNPPIENASKLKLCWSKPTLSPIAKILNNFVGEDR